MKRTAAIVGFGLLGTSLGMALRGGPFIRTGWTRRKEVRRWAIENDAADQVFDTPEELLAQADLTILALPIPCILEFIPRYAGCWKKGAVVTDMGSIKGEIMTCGVQTLAPHGVCFIGSHPMAGTEKSGPYAAFPELYRNADTFVCCAPGTPEEAAELVEKLWLAAGARPGRLDPERHDALVAHTSHVLHVLASALACSILDAPDEAGKRENFRGCATGFRDSSRIASSNPAMWREIIEHNQPAVLAALDDFDREYHRMREMIASGDYDGFEREFARGKRLRDEWVRYKGF